ARDGQTVLGEHFPGGSGTPAVIIVDEQSIDEVAETVLGSDGVASLAVLPADSPSGTAPVTTDGIQPVGPPGTPSPEPTVVDGQVMLQATLTDAGDSLAAEQTVRELRTAFEADAHGALVGGVTAVAL